MLDNRSYRVVEEQDRDRNLYGFDLYFDRVWCYEMFKWCADNFGRPYDSLENPEGIWSRIRGWDSSPYTSIRFETVENAIAFKMRFL